MPFPDGSMMRLTVAHYYTPTGRDIQKPYTKGKQKEYQQDMLDRLNRGELMHKDSIKYIDSLRVNTLTLHRPIYGGGGISPDKFVPLDTTEYTKYYRNVMAKGLLNRYAIEYVDNHRNEIKKQYKTDSDYVKRFQITSEMLNTLKEMADKEGVEYNAEQAELSVPLFKMILKALIGRDIYENATYFKVYNQYDPIFNEALKLINSQDYTTILSQS
jgi:carboxyl-terminal processing protease